ncbi:MAG: AraC family transcriptional regulator [Clostridium sp.]
MKWLYPITDYGEGLPIKISLIRFNDLVVSWHNEFEVLIVLSGSINIMVEDTVFILKEDSIMFINSNDLHRINSITEDSMVLVMKIDREYYSRYYLCNDKLILNYKALLESENNKELFKIIKYYISKIIKNIFEKNKGYRLLVGSEINLLIHYMINNYEDYFITDGDYKEDNKDGARLKRIIKYILNDGLSLNDIAIKEDLSIYYVSHFIKKKLGVSFQEIVNIIRMDRGIGLLIKTDKSITTVALESGFPSLKAFNRKFKSIYGYSPSEFRKRETKEIINKKANLQLGSSQEQINYLHNKLDLFIREGKEYI